MEGIVIGVDGSQGSADALVWAERESRVRGVPVTAVMAWGLLDQHRPDDGEFDPAYGPDQAEAALDAAVSAALGSTDGVGRVTVNDLPARALLEAADGASLLVVGARGLGGFAGLLLGSVSQQCLNHAPCPVAIIRAPAPPAPGAGDEAPERIVVGVDGSSSSLEALAWALDEARARDAQVVAVAVWHDPYLGTGLMGVSTPVDWVQDAAQTMLDRAVDGADTSGLAHAVERVLAYGSPALTLLDVAREAALLVVGSRGRGGFAGLLLGSVSSHVAHHATCPLVVLRGSG